MCLLFVLLPNHREKSIIFPMPNDNSSLKMTSELTPLKKAKKEKRRLPKPLSLLFKMLAALLFSLVMGINGQIIYDYSRYEKFYVNGESMYPTLNRDVTVTDKNGNDVTPSSLGDFGHSGWSYTCDYGLMDTDKSTLEGLSRFDIVVTYYGNDMVLDETNGTYSPKPTAALKIKRIIGLPGEELYFDSNGDLHIADGFGGFPIVEQPFLTPQSDWSEELIEWTNKTKKQTAMNVKYGTEGNHMKLKEGEYFVVGDNREYRASNDSREEGALPFHCFVGKAIAITAKCRYTVSSSASEGTQSLLWNTIRMPWDIYYL